MPRGVRRPGAGAPKHNFNSLKTGRRSERIYVLALCFSVNLLIQITYKRNIKYRRLYLAQKFFKNQSNSNIF